MQRFYLCDIVGTGTSESPFRPALEDAVPGVGWVAVDGRADPTAAGGWMLVIADVTDAQHTTLIGDARIRSLPIEDNKGVPLSLDAPLSQLSVARLNSLRNDLELRHVPFNDLSPTMSIREGIQRVVRRLVLRQVLGPDDFTGSFTDQATISPARLAKLQERGYDTSVILPTDSVRGAMQKLLTQSGKRINRTLVD